MSFISIFRLPNFEENKHINMANTLGSRLARVDVLIGGADQAKKKLQEMRDEASRLAKEVENARQAMADSVDTVEYDKKKAEYEKLLKQQKELQRSIGYSERNINTVEKYLSDISNQTLRNLNNAQRSLKQILLGVDPKDLESIKAVQDLIKQVSDEVQRRKGNIVEFSDIIGDIGNVSEKSLGMAKQRLQELISTTQTNTKEIQTYREQLKKVEDEEQRRISSKAGRVMGNLDGSSVAEIQEAINVTTKLRDAQKLGGQEWEIYNDEIQRAQKYLSDYNSLTKQVAMSDRMKELGKASESSLSELKKFWQEQVNGAQSGSQELAEYEENLKKVIKEEQNRISNRAQTTLGKVQTGTFDGTISQTKEAIKLLEQYKQQLKTSDTKGVKEVE